MKCVEMAEELPKKSQGGCMSRLGVLFLTVVFGCIVAICWFITQPQDLSDLGGREPAVQGESPRDLTMVLRKSLENGHSLALRESELNRWLGSNLKCEQSGMLARWFSLERIWVRIADGHAEVIQERRVLGRTFTVSMFLSFEQLEENGRSARRFLLHSGPFLKDLPRPCRGGRIGRLVVPEGFLIFIMPSYQKLAEAYKEEIAMAFQKMSDVRLEKNRLILNPTAEDPDANKTR